MPTSEQLRVAAVDAAEEVERHRGAWGRLLQLTPGANFFQTCDWLTCWWRHDRRQRWRCLLCFEGNQLAGALPLAMRHERTRVGTLRVLGYPLDHWGTHFGPIGPNPSAILKSAFADVAARPRDWDVLDLRWIPESQRELAAAAAADAGLAGTMTPFETTSVIELGGTWYDYWRTRTSKLRNNVRRCEKRLARWGRMEVVHHRPPDEERDPRWDLYEQCEQVAAASWQGESSNGNTLSHAGVRDFLRDVHGWAAGEGNVSMHLLLIDGQPAAFAYNYVFQRRVFGLRMGFVPTYRSVSPGSILLGRMIEDSFQRGDREIMLGEGEESYKCPWRTGVETTYRFCYYAPFSPRAQALRWKRWLVPRPLASPVDTALQPLP